MARHASQDADDMICRPATFSRTLGDGSVEITFQVRQQCQVLHTALHGELIVWQSTGGEMFVKIVEEPK